MKKILLFVAVAATYSITSCGGVDVDKAAEEYCDCMKKESSEDQMSCINDWSEKYKDAKGSESDAEELMKKISECK